MFIKLALAEDNTFLLNSIIEKLSLFEDISLKHICKNGEDIVKKIERDSNIDVILMDIQMPKMSGIEATEIIKQKHPQIKIIMLTVFDDDDNIFKSIQAGADGYLLKETDMESLHNGIKEIKQGGAPMTPIIALKALNILRKSEYDNSQPDEKLETVLTNRQVEILEQISNGLNYKEIAKNLFISSSTVNKHIENIYKKLQVHNKTDAISKASKFGII